MKSVRFVSTVAAFTLLVTANSGSAAPVIGDINTATITHNPGFGTPIVTGPGPMAIRYALNRVEGGPGGAFSDGAGYVQTITQDRVFGLTFPEMLISQSAPAGGVTEATLRFDLNISFVMDANGFGPNPFEYYYFALEGNSGGPGDYVRFDLDMDAYAADGKYGPGWHASFMDEGGGPFSTVVQGRSEFLRSLAPGEVLEMRGSVTLTASDPIQPVEIHLTRGGFNVPDSGSTATLMAIAFGSFRLFRRRLAKV